MRVMDLYPISVTPTNAWRNVEELSAREWTEAIEALDDLREAYDAAHERALEEWNRRYVGTRERYCSPPMCCRTLVMKRRTESSLSR